MSNMPQRLARPSSRNLLARVLDEPDLPVQIQSLSPVVFSKLVDHIGLEDAGELVALATMDQLAHAFDEDLWKNQQPGEEERFDADRFLVWLEVLLEAGDAFVASRLVQMPEDLVTLAFHRYMFVLDVDALAQDMQAADEVDARQLDKALESCLYEELDGFQLMARDPDGWDTILSIVLALDRDYHDYLQRLLDRCCHMTTEYIDDNGGLYEVLTSEEMLESDVAADREDRRAEAGYVAPSAAAAFLKLARAGTAMPEGKRDAVTNAYFRNLRPANKGTPSGGKGAPAGAKGAAPGATGTPSSARPSDTGMPSAARSSDTRTRAGQAAEGLTQVLKDAGVVIEPAARPLLMSGPPKGDPLESLLVDTMRALAEQDPRAFDDRSEELAYLSNVLLTGCTMQRRRLRPIEAVRVALATCNLALCQALPDTSSAHDEDSSKQALAALQRLGADHLFRMAWHCLYTDVIEAAARAAQRLLEKVASLPKDETAPPRSHFDEQERALAKHGASALDKACQQGAPWQAISALDPLMTLIDARDAETLGGLLDPCPSLPAEEAEAGRPASGPAAPRFISTPAMLDEVRRFLGRLKLEPRAEPAQAAPPREKSRRRPATPSKDVKR